MKQGKAAMVNFFWFTVGLIAAAAETIAFARA